MSRHVQWSVRAMDIFPTPAAAEVDTRIRERMDLLQLSVTALAETTGIPRMTLTRRLTDPSSLKLPEIERIAEALGVTWLYLMKGTPAIS